MAALPASFLPCSERRSIRSAEHSRLSPAKIPRTGRERKKGKIPNAFAFGILLVPVVGLEPTTIIADNATTTYFCII